MAITNPAEARMLVFDVVTEFVGSRVNLPANDVDVSRTFVGNPPDGYGFNEGAFLIMCDTIAPILATRSGHALTLPGDFRVDHENDAINVFINAVAVRMLAPPALDARV